MSTSSSKTPSSSATRSASYNTTYDVTHSGSFGDMGAAILGTATSMTIAAILMVAARLYVRLKMTRSWGLDDYCILVALALSIAGYGLVVPGVYADVGRRAEVLTQSQIERGRMLNFVVQSVFVWAVTFVKVSVALFLLRIAPSRPYRLFLYGMMAFLWMYTAIICAATLTQCRPLNNAWRVDFEEEKCLIPASLRGLDYSNNCLCLVTDIVLALLPIPMLWHVQLRRKVKAVIIAILSLGVFAAVANGVRIAYLSQARDTQDYLVDSARITICTTIECNLGIIAASLPCAKPLFKRLFIFSIGSRISNTNTGPPSTHSQGFGDFYFANVDSRYVFPMNPLIQYSSRPDWTSDTSPVIIRPNRELTLRADLQPVRQRGAFDDGEILYPRGHVGGGGIVLSRPIPEDDVNWMYASVSRELSRPHVKVLIRPLQAQRNPQAKESRRESVNGTDAARSSDEKREFEQLQARKLYAEANGYAWKPEDESAAYRQWEEENKSQESVSREEEDLSGRLHRSDR